MSYRQQINKHGLRALNKAPNIPDYHLMVGSAEDLSSKPLVLYEKALPDNVGNMVRASQALKEDENLQEKLNTNVLEVNDIMGNISLIGSGL